MSPPVYDWRELQRFGIPEARLPEAGTVLFRQPSFWERHWRVMLVAGVLFLMQTTLVVILLLQRRRRLIAERAVRESEERMRLATDAADIGTWSWDVTDNSLWASDRSRQLFGFQPGELISFTAFVERIHPEDRSRVEERAVQAIRKKTRYREEYRILRPDGTQSWVVSLGSLLTDKSGKPLKLMGSTLDITVQRRAETQLTELSRQLAHASRLGILGEVASTIAHELNQPLTAILSNAQAAKRLLAEDNADLNDIWEIFDDIIRDDKRAGDIVHSTRTLLGKGTHTREPVNISQSIEEVAALLRGKLQEEATVLEIDLSPSLPQVPADKVEVLQVLLNLALNGIESMGDIDPSFRKLTISARRNGTMVVMSVADNGIGIPPAMAHHVFRPFRTTKTKGLGLGLAICRRIAEAHGGKLWFENNRSGGATFHFGIPCTASHPSSPF